MEFVFESNMNGDGIPGSSDFMSADVSSPHQNDVMDLPVAPTVREKPKARRTSRRKLPENFSDIEFNEPSARPRKRAAGPKVNYVKSVKKPKGKRKSAKKFNWTWNKAGWIFCGLLVFRMIFMESGLLDYYNMHQFLENKQSDLVLLRQENASLIQEINKIKTSASYQKKLARDHLGVIAKDEYLILFSRERELSSSI